MTNSLPRQEIKRALLAARFPFELLGAVLFGSRVKNRETGESDFDLLIVAEGISSRLHRRGEEIAAIKRSLSPLPCDILLYTEKEAISNFQNHNPLFLDIADEGLLLFDSDSGLETLMNQTREYVREKGIKKLDDGWVFPVRPGVPTPLSKVSNKDFSWAMLEDGKRDLTVANKLLQEKIYDKAVYHFQQAVEKNIKSILVATGVFKKTHFVGEVLRTYVQEKKFPEKWQDDLLEAAEISESVEPDVSLSRYPGIIDDSLWLPFEEYEEEDAVKARVKAVRVHDIAQSFYSDWFSSDTDKS